MIRCLGPEGIEVLVAAPRSDMAVWSRWAERLIPPLPESADPQHLAEALDRQAVRNPVLIPCSDLWAEAVARLSEVKPDLPSLVGPWSAVGQLLDKWRLAEQLQKAGVPHPETFRVDGPSDLGVLDDRPGRFILKPRHSQSFAKAFGVKAFSVTDRLGAAKAVESATAAGQELILQEYIPGPSDATTVFVDGYVDQTGSMAACFTRRRLRSYPTGLGNTAAAVSIPVADVGGAVGELERLFRAAGYRGIFNAEWKLDHRDDILKLIEVNCRAWWYTDFSARCGVNICLLAYRDAIGRPLDRPAVDGYRAGETQILMLPDLRSLAGLRRTGELSVLRWLLESARTLAAIRNPADPLPALATIAQPLARVLRWARERIAGS